ncbi:MAG: glycosyltransferase [Clostridia bacterium]
MKKITILSLHLDVGGAENAISSISNILAKENEVEIISTYKINEKPAFHIDDRVKIKYLLEDLKPNREKFRNAIKSFDVLKILKEGFYSLKVLYFRKKKMKEAIKECDSDIIISTRLLYNKWLGKYGKDDSIKIAQEHNHHNGNIKIIRKTINSLKNIDYFMPVSQELADFYSDALKETKTKCVYIPHSLDIYPDKTSDLDRKNLVSVGRLSPEKGFLDLIDVFKGIHDLDNDVKLYIAGDGPQKAAVEERIRELELEESVILLGFVSKKELEKIYLNSSVYVMTSFTESFGLVLIEAESYGIPSVVFDSAQGAKEIIENGKNGYLISNRNKNLMIKKVLDLLYDNDLKKSMGVYARKNSEKYKVENIEKIWKRFFIQISE